MVGFSFRNVQKKSHLSKKQRQKAGVEEVEMEVESLQLSAEDTVVDDGTFVVRVGGASGMGGASGSAVGGDSRDESEQTSQPFWPCGRMNSCLAVKNGVLYVYGGLYEDNTRQVTLSDMYSLDLHKLDKWNIIIPHDTAAVVSRM